MTPQTALEEKGFAAEKLSSFPGKGKSPKAGDFVFWLVGGLVAVNVLIGAFIGLKMHEARVQYEERATTTTQNLAIALENEIGGILRATDLALLAVIDEYERQSKAGGVDGKALQPFIDRIKARLPFVNAIRLSDARGRLVYGSDVPAGSAVDISDRPYFVAARDRADAGLVISKPQKSRVNGAWVIVLARRLTDVRGAFAGVAFMPIAAEDMSQTLSRIDVGRKGSITLRGEDLGMISRHPRPGAFEAMTGSSVVSDEFRSLIEGGRNTGTFQAVNPVDGIDRLLSYRRVGGHPLYIVVGLAGEEYLSQWRVDTLRAAAAAAVFFFVTAALSWLVFRYWNKLRLANEALEHRANTDFLTGLANRRAFLEAGALELVRAARYGQAVSLLMLDIDHFKRVNDTHGHAIGDLVLRNFAALCAGTLREVDTMGRLGGEEFALILPETGPVEAAEVAERIREAVAATMVAVAAQLPIPCTVSIGVATYLGEDDNIERLINRADQALYRAKERGRNQVCVHPAGVRPSSARFALA